MNKSALVLLLMSALAHADFAQIYDADGYTNLREQPNANSRIIRKIPTKTYVYTPEGDLLDFQKNGWIWAVDVRNQRAVEGWIHRSRLKPLSAWERIAVRNTADGFRCVKNGMGAQFSVGKFDFQQNRRDFSQTKNGYLTQYRGKDIFGTDGQPPETHFREIRFVRNGKTTLVPRSQYEFLFNPYFDSMPDKDFTQVSHCHYRAQDDTFFVSTVIGDGAAYSEVLFVFEQGSLKTVLASLHPYV